MPSKWLKDFMAKKYEEHRKRVKEARTTLDKKKPPSMPMSMRGELERKRVQAAIEQDNRLLMDRLGAAMSVKNIDNELHAKPFVSYIELQRKKDMIRVTSENKRLLDRIQKAQPSYNTLQWEAEAERRVHYLRNMTQFPDLFNPPALQAAEKAKRKTEKILLRADSRQGGRRGGGEEREGGEGEEEEGGAVSFTPSFPAPAFSPPVPEHEKRGKQSRPFLPPI